MAVSLSTLEWLESRIALEQSRHTLTLEDYKRAAYAYVVILVLLCAATLAVFGAGKERKLARELAVKAKEAPGGGEDAIKSRALAEEASKAEKRAMKRLSWGLSCFNSALLTAMGGVYCFVLVRKSGFALTLHDLQNTNNISGLTCLWFALFNATDLIFGTLFYPKQMDPLTAYVHHPLYIYIMFACSTGTYGFWWSASKQSLVAASGAPFSSSFMLSCLEELPTLILGVGSVVPALRSDMGFGASFFVLRIVYHGFLMSQSLYVRVDPIQSGLFGLTMIMHLFWFKGWVVSMLGKSAQPKTKRQ